MRTLGRSWRAGSSGRKMAGIGLAIGGAWVVVRILPLWIWPVGLGLWLVWAGLGPLIVGGLMCWLGWRLFSEA